MIYLASPYSDEDFSVMEYRFKEVAGLTAHYLQKGLIVYSPIVHGHQLAIDYSLPKGYVFWQKHCLGMVDAASELYVYQLDGWEESIGLADEIARAHYRGIPVKYIDMKWRADDDS